MDKIALVATLNDGKKVLIEPNYYQSKMHYRYLSDIEVENETLEMNKKYIWHETPLYSTVEQGETLIFATIGATPVVVNRI